MANANVRVRFCPSPTGNPHVGLVRTALFNWAFARHHQGTLVFRIEDTDAARDSEESYGQLLDAMRFLLTPARTREMLVQWSKEDRIFVLPFNDHIMWMERATGDEGEQARLLSRTIELHAAGGTDFYSCGARALAAMKPLLAQGRHLPAMVIMTEGKSQGLAQTFQ